MSEVGRNDPCPCGSGIKFKKCCLIKASVEKSKQDAEVEAWLATDFALGEQRIAEFNAKHGKMTLSEACGFACGCHMNVNAA